MGGGRRVSQDRISHMS
ncbi:hypothetical protein LINPERHAP2_LOCUS27329 [Linum perenne]